MLSEFAGRKEPLDVDASKVLQVFLEDLLVGEALAAVGRNVMFAEEHVDFLEHLELQGFGLAVETSNVVDGLYCFGVATFGEEELRTFRDLEDEDSNETKDNGYASKGNHHITPVDEQYKL